MSKIIPLESDKPGRDSYLCLTLGSLGSALPYTDLLGTGTPENGGLEAQIMVRTWKDGGDPQMSERI